MVKCCFIQPHLLWMNFCKLYMVLAVSYWLLNISCLYCHMLWFFTLSITITMKLLLVQCAVRIFGMKEILTQLKKHQGKPTGNICLDGSYSWPRMSFILDYLLNKTLKKMYTILRLLFLLTYLWPPVLGNAALENIFLITI